MKKYTVFVYISFLLVSVSSAYSQVNLMPRQAPRIAILAPLYLDSVFNGPELKNEKSIPRFIMPGVEFIQGAQIAFDSLSAMGIKLTVQIFDSRSVSQPVGSLIKSGRLNDFSLIIGSVKDPEFKQLADFSRAKKIPFISATYPNDGGIRDNPYLIIVNSTLKAHIEGIFSYLLQKHGTDPIYLVKRKNDNRIDNYFKALNTAEGKSLLQIKPIILDSSISTYGLRRLLDTTKQLVVIGGSLEEKFSRQLAESLYPIQQNNRVLFLGMPNWEGFRSFYQKDFYKGYPILFTTPHFESRESVFYHYLDERYFSLYRTKPTEMAAKGFESAWYFANILLQYKEGFAEHLNEDRLAPLHEFIFRPVTERNGDTTDYIENKHLYFMQILNGEVSRKW